MRKTVAPGRLQSRRRTEAFSLPASRRRWHRASALMKGVKAGASKWGFQGGDAASSWEEQDGVRARVGSGKGKLDG